MRASSGIQVQGFGFPGREKDRGGLESFKYYFPYHCCIGINIILILIIAFLLGEAFAGIGEDSIVELNNQSLSLKINLTGHERN